jgi:hypothetical protein
MRGHNVLFDIDNSRIGMAESTCDYKLLMTGEAEEEFMDPYPTRDEIMKSHNRNVEEYLNHSFQKFRTLFCTLWVLSFIVFFFGLHVVMSSMKVERYQFLLKVYCKIKRNIKSR